MDKTSLRRDLEQLDFFRYTDPQYFETVENELIDNIINKQAFLVPWGKERQNIDGRLFSIDSESLTEGGALDLFNEVRPSLEKAGLKVYKVEQVFEDNAGSKRPIYTFILNNRSSNLSRVPLIPFLLWGLVTVKYLKFLNRELRRSKIKERFYLMNDSSSDTELAFLTPAQAKFINSLNLNPNDKVYKPGLLMIFRPALQIIRVIFIAMFRKKVKE